MSEKPRCYYCGKFLSPNPATLGSKWDTKLIWTGYPCPEPDYDVYWHTKCKEPQLTKTEQNVSNENLSNGSER